MRVTHTYTHTIYFAARPGLCAGHDSLVVSPPCFGLNNPGSNPGHGTDVTILLPSQNQRVFSDQCAIILKCCGILQVIEKIVLAFRANRLGGQVVRRRSRKPKIRGSIPRRAWGFRMLRLHNAKRRVETPRRRRSA